MIINLGKQRLNFPLKEDSTLFFFERSNLSFKCKFVIYLGQFSTKKPLIRYCLTASYILFSDGMTSSYLSKLDGK